MARGKKNPLEIVEELGIIGEKGNSVKELNKVSWFEKPTTIDIRTWYYNDDGERKAGKGTNLDDNEACELCKLLIKAGYGEKKKKNKKYTED